MSRVQSAARPESTCSWIPINGDEARHGYALIEAVSELSDGRYTMRASTLYGALDRLSADGLIAVDREEVVSSRLRRYYRLTDTGVQALEAEAARQRRNAAEAARRLRARAKAAKAAKAAGTARPREA